MLKNKIVIKFTLLFLIAININCKTMPQEYTNQLINESSPYLLQHAQNPVNWMPWGEEALNKAKTENKPIIVSIGYSSCHWCHVMEHESFEDLEVAKLMNEHFICIKVDREEHPDIDAIYMNALQIITGSGGWPLNCFTMPDGRPFYCGTYFPKARWISVLNQISTLYETDPSKAEEYAQKIEDGIKQSDLIVKDVAKYELDAEIPIYMVQQWKSSWDNIEGGPNRAPKFPLPNNFEFLLNYAHLYKSESTQTYVDLTLKKMAFGGIYDQLRGGFARYSTDVIWKAPHFEKMLYDNAQLISLYSHAYQYFNSDYLKQIIKESLAFVEAEMTSETGLFYSALDADSEGKEGLFYIWKMDEIDQVLGKDSEIFKAFYQVNEVGLWEDDYYILMHVTDEEKILSQFSITQKELSDKISYCKTKLLKQRNKRIRPGLDDKQLLSWNSMMVTAYLDAYMALADKAYLATAKSALDSILEIFTTKNGELLHTHKNSEAKISAFHDDYAFLIQALIKMYQASFDEKYLLKANALTEKTFDLFYNEQSGMFYFTSSLQASLISRKTEIYDNVIPSSNSVMARNLFHLSRYFGNNEYLEHAQQMLQNMSTKLTSYPSGYSNWGILAIEMSLNFSEVVISGPNAESIRAEMQKQFLPQVIFAGSIIESKLPLLEGRYNEENTLIYVCENQSCQLPVKDASKALKLINM